MSPIGEKSPSSTKTQPRHRTLGFTDDAILDYYAQMVLARAMDERLLALNRQGKVPLVASLPRRRGRLHGHGLGRKNGRGLLSLPLLS